MATLTLSSRKAVLQAASECEAMGRENFLTRHGFRKAREYFLLLNGKRYDSKAIAGVAYGYENPNEGPLAASAFSGGENTVRRVLQELGFTVVKGVPKHNESGALVLVENEVTVGGAYDFWADDTGVRYQFPNQYRNRVRPGRPFVYYRGVRRSGGKRGTPEYFGAGIIGEVWSDPSQPADTPARQRRWYCAIEDYEPFLAPVPAKPDGKPFENIGTATGWRTGVREIEADIFDRIVDIARAGRRRNQAKTVSVADAKVSQAKASDLLISRPPSKPGSGQGARYRSREAKRIGDWAEELVYRWLLSTLNAFERDTLDWVAQRAETPGWDIEYTSASGVQIRVEVKATTLARFSGIEITGNEWQAAQRDGDKYVLALVSGAMSTQPHIALLWNPAKHAADGEVAIEATSFRLTIRSDA